MQELVTGKKKGCKSEEEKQKVYELVWKNVIGVDDICGCHGRYGRSYMMNLCIIPYL